MQAKGDVGVIDKGGHGSPPPRPRGGAYCHVGFQDQVTNEVMRP